MKRRIHVLFVTVSLLCTQWYAAAEDDAVVSLNISEASIEVSGTSTLHDWEISSTMVEGEVQLPADLLAQEDWTAWLAAHPEPLPIRVKLFLPVNSLKSGKKGMDKVTWKTLKQSDFPQITYRMDEAAPAEAGESKDAAFRGVVLVTQGVVTAAGAERNLSTEMSFEPQADGTIVVAGHAKMKISDFQIKPPTAMAGMIKTGDDIEVQFRWQVAKGN